MNEKPFTGRYWNSEAKGTYLCATCGSKLFSSKEKFDSGTGWATFLKPIEAANVSTKDNSEIVCTKCGGHVGELVGDKDKHYRVDSMALDFEEMELPFFADRLKDELEGATEDKIKEKIDNKSAAQTPTAASPWKNTLLFIGALVVGGGIGASAATIYQGAVCQTSGSNQTPVVTGMPASSTPTGGNSNNAPVKPSGTPTPPKPASTTPAGGAATSSTGTGNSGAAGMPAATSSDSSTGV